MTEPQYSIIIPAYNEQARIGSTLDRVLDSIRDQQWSAEVLVVNDGSRDNTAQIVRSIARENPSVRLIENARNRGKGYSVRNGILQGRGQVVMFTDADLSAPIEEAQRLFDAIANGADVAIGSRWIERDRQTVRQSWYRRFFGRCFNWLTRLVMRMPFADTQCGFKAFRRQAAHEIFIRQRVERWGFDPEILYIALRRGLRVIEIPVTWGHDERSRISYLRDGIRMVHDLLRIRWNSLVGTYDGDHYMEGAGNNCAGTPCRSMATTAKPDGLPR